MDIFGGLRASRAMAGYAFHHLDAKLNGKRVAVSEEDGLPLSSDVHGLFVTYEKLNGDLRGCIGTFQKANLGDSLGRFSVVSALKDTRFPPVSNGELPGLSCSVTVLSELMPTEKWDSWTIGQHGISIHLNDAGRNYSATFLPSVIEEQGWTKHQTFEHLLRKSGYPGHPTPDVFSKCEVYTYEGSKAKLTHDEYISEFGKRWS